jgi:hypothetical protein
MSRRKSGETESRTSADDPPQIGCKRHRDYKIRRCGQRNVAAQIVNLPLYGAHIAIERVFLRTNHKRARLFHAQRLPREGRKIRKVLIVIADRADEISSRLQSRDAEDTAFVVGGTTIYRPWIVVAIVRSIK